MQNGTPQCSQHKISKEEQTRVTFMQDSQIQEQGWPVERKLESGHREPTGCAHQSLSGLQVDATL